jgi:hypothetical protein
VNGVRAHPLVAAAAVLALASLVLLAPSTARGAAGSAASSASQSVGFSIGSISGSLKNSSGSSSTAADVAEADYEVVDIVAVEGDPDLLRLRLRAPATGDAAAAPAELVLELPRRAVEQGQLAPGRSVSARHRVYGIEFASGEPRTAFFLVLDDEWYRELRLQAVAS